MWSQAIRFPVWMPALSFLHSKAEWLVTAWVYLEQVEFNLNLWGTLRRFSNHYKSSTIGSGRQAPTRECQFPWRPSHPSCPKPPPPTPTTTTRGKKNPHWQAHVTNLSVSRLVLSLSDITVCVNICLCLPMLVIAHLLLLGRFPRTLRGVRGGKCKDAYIFQESWEVRN